MLEGWHEKLVCQGQGNQQVSPSLEDTVALVWDSLLGPAEKS